MSFLSAVFGRALASRNYRLYFAGQLVSLAGTWMQQLAMIWLAYRLSNSALVLGTVGFASQIPILLLGPFMGVLTDRFDRRRILIVTQSIAMTHALALAAFTWLQWISPAGLIGMAFVLGCVNALDVPARQAFAAQLVDKREDLPNAIALNSLLMNSARFVGPALAGFAVASIGEAWCFALNAATYPAMIMALVAIETKTGGGKRTEAPFEAFRQGIRYALRRPDIRSRLLLVAAVAFLVTPYAVLMPLFAKEIFHGDARTYGLLIASAGAGALLAALHLASRRETGGLSQRVIAATTTSGVTLSLFALNREIVFAYPIVMALGFSVITVIAGSNTLIQVWVEDAFRGRVMAIFSMAFLGVAPLGSLAVGHAAHLAGVQPALLACGIATAVLGLAAKKFMP